MKTNALSLVSTSLRCGPVLLLTLLLLGGGLVRAAADDVIINPDVPALGTNPGPSGGTSDAEDIIRITFTDGTSENVPIAVPAGTKLNSDKADLMVAALSGAGFTAEKTLGNGVKLNKVKPANAAKGTPEKKFDGKKSITIIKHSGETDTVAFGGFVPGSIATIAYQGNLSGTDAFGNEAIYTSAIGYDGVMAQASLSFHVLSAPTIDALLTDTFHILQNQLPTSFQGELSLDLINDEITFVSPGAVSNPFVTNGATDTGVAASESLGTLTPEPSGLALFGAGALALVGFAACGWLCRARTSRKSGVVSTRTRKRASGAGFLS